MSSDSAFYGDGSAVIQATTEAGDNSRLSQSTFDVDEYYEIARCVEWLKSNSKLNRVALQFPDELLGDSVAVIAKLQSELPALTFYILADTSYGSCCVDVVAAEHYSADALIHYGPSCLSQTSSIPVLWVFGRGPVVIADCAAKISETVPREASTRNYVLMFDVQYDYIIDELFLALRASMPSLVRSHLRSSANQQDPVTHRDSDSSHHIEVNGRSWCSTSANSQDYDVIYIGGEGRTLTTLMMVMSSSKFYSYNPLNRTSRAETVNVNKLLMRRLYLIEKAKDANIIGIVVGTLAVSNYLLIHKRIKELIKKAGKKSYTLVIGKLNTAKLANFMEVDIFVLVGCPENTLVDSSQYYKPIITPYELELSCNTERKWQGDYVADFGALLPDGSRYEPIPDTIQEGTDVSLVTGGMRSIGMSEGSLSSGPVAVRNTDTTLATTSSAKTAGEFLVGRSWTGLEQDLGKTPVEKARQGRKGIAMGYENEPSCE